MDNDCLLFLKENVYYAKQQADKDLSENDFEFFIAWKRVDEVLIKSEETLKAFVLM